MRVSELWKDLEGKLAPTFSEQFEAGTLTPEGVARQSLGYPIFTSAKNPATMATILANVVANPSDEPDANLAMDFLLAMCEEAETNESMRLAAGEAVVLITEKGEPLPQELAQLARAFIIGEKKEQRRRGAPPISKIRNEAIAAAVSDVAHWFPKIKPTRNPATERPSACSIVADELVRLARKSEIFPALGEDAVQKIWKNHR